MKALGNRLQQKESINSTLYARVKVMMTGEFI